ncbi:MAG: hypothetical protein ABFS56_01900 [Pseudomonadota bacterium]
MMTPEEQAQRQRFHFAKHRHQYLITRALVRTTLSPDKVGNKNTLPTLHLFTYC